MLQKLGNSVRVLILALFIQALPGCSEESDIRILSPGQTFHKPENATVTFPCSVQNLGTSVITWYRESQVLSADSFLVIQDSRLSVQHTPGSGSVLTLSRLRKSDAGVYTCAVNSKERVLRLSHHLLINLPPQILPLNTEDVITVAVGSKVKLQCHANGHPKPNIYWTRQHNQAFPWEPRQLTIQGGILEFPIIGREYGGEYLCNAENGVGKGPAVHSLHLNVLYPPDVEVEKWYYHGKLGETATLTCYVHSNPLPKVTWYKNTMKHFDSDRVVSRQVGFTHKLVIFRLREEDLANYSCRAENSLNREVIGSIMLSGCPTPPLITGEEYSKEKYSYDLTWSTTSHYPVLHHQILIWPRRQANLTVDESPDTKKVMVKGGQAPYSYNFRGLQVNHTFTVKVRSKNRFGWGPYSHHFSFHMFPREKQPMEMKGTKEIFKIDAPLKSDGLSSLSPPLPHSPLLPLSSCIVFFLLNSGIGLS